MSRKRIQNIKKQLKLEARPAALLLSSAKEVLRSRDTFYPYRQQSDFYYLTGIKEPGVALLITAKNKPQLFVQRRDSRTVLWEGPPPNLQPTAKKLGAELVVSDNLNSDILKALRKINHLYYQNDTGTVAQKIAEKLFALPSSKRSDYPIHFSHSDVLLEPLRVIKDSGEIKIIQKAINITSVGLEHISALIKPGVNESDIKTRLENAFRESGAEVAFPSIVAAGRSAATLHYSAHMRRLQRSELLLVDCGAEYELYSADITRVFPVAGVFKNELLLRLYDIVLEAQYAAIEAVRPGVTTGKLYNAAARVLTRGLCKLGVIRGPWQKAFKKGAYRLYFPHGIGHSLGIDTHDLSNLRNNNKALLKEGMVITIEPGLYFAKKTGQIPACGIRIEDDILVTRDGAKILSRAIPKERTQIEEFIKNAG
ncbi:MAG: M24 family metallopeptidase [Candidatus Dadabacteria bacterium]|nr:MAG: M24 family metallopeptidase [Candidatus Dadabacteria bacterium]